jgi:hypothetical protein
MLGQLKQQRIFSMFCFQSITKLNRNVHQLNLIRISSWQKGKEVISKIMKTSDDEEVSSCKAEIKWSS